MPARRPRGRSQRASVATRPSADLPSRVHELAGEQATCYGPATLEQLGQAAWYDLDADVLERSDLEAGSREQGCEPATAEWMRMACRRRRGQGDVPLQRPDARIQL